jgi:hypothetical protein
LVAWADGLVELQLHVSLAMLHVSSVLQMVQMRQPVSSSCAAASGL